MTRRTAFDHMDPDWIRYPETVLHFESGVAGHPTGELEAEATARTAGRPIDLRRRIGGVELAALRALGLDRPFAVITADDPRGENLETQINQERRHRLEAELGASAVTYARVNACSPDGAHCESSLAVPVSYDYALTIARRYDQVAIFWFDGERFWIVPVLFEAKPVRLPRSM